MLFLSKIFQKFLFSARYHPKAISFTVYATIYIHTSKWTYIISVTERSTSSHSCWLLLFLPVMVAILTSANVLVQICDELNLENLLGLKLSYKEEVCGRMS